MNSFPIISSLHIYPVKSCAGIQVDSFHAGKRGPEYEGHRDRSWMVIDQDGKLVSQRQNPRLTQMRVNIIDAVGSRPMLELSVPRDAAAAFKRGGCNR